MTLNAVQVGSATVRVRVTVLHGQGRPAEAARRLARRTAYMSPQRCMQADLARSSNLNLTLYIENFIKEKVSEILPLWIILTDAIGRIWHPSQP